MKRKMVFIESWSEYAPVGTDAEAASGLWVHGLQREEELRTNFWQCKPPPSPPPPPEADALFWALNAETVKPVLCDLKHEIGPLSDLKNIGDCLRNTVITVPMVPWHMVQNYYKFTSFLFCHNLSGNISSMMRFLFLPISLSLSFSARRILKQSFISCLNINPDKKIEDH